MLLPGLVFGMVLAIVCGAYWLAVLRPEQAGEAQLRKRLSGTRTTGPVREVLVKEVERLSTLPAFNSLLSGQSHLVGPLKTLVEQSGVKVTVGVVLLASALGGALALLVGQWLSGRFWVGLLLAALALPIPVAALRWKRAKRIAKFEELFPEAIDLLSRALRAGHAFTTGLGMVAEELPQPISSEFRLLFDRQNFGLPLDEALRDFAERVPLLDARFFATAVLTQREAGGNLSEVLDNLAAVIRDRFTLKRQVRAKSAHGRVTGWVLSAMPPVLALILLVISPGYLRPLVEEPAGIRLIVVGVTLQVVGTLIIRKIVRVDF